MDINNIIKSFKARDTIEAGLSAVAAYLQGIQNVGVQDYSTSVSSMQNAVVCRVGGVITDLIDGKFQPRTAITL